MSAVLEKIKSRRSVRKFTHERIPQEILEQMVNWNPSFQFASLSSDLANRLQK